MPTQISRKLWKTIKLHRTPAYRIAQDAGLHPNTLSKIINGIDPVEYGDVRVLAVGHILGLAEGDLFEVTPDTDWSSECEGSDGTR